MNRSRIYFFTLSLWVLSLSFSACGGEGTTDTPPPADSSVKAPSPGQKAMEEHCIRCHALPDPKALDKTTWNTYVLVRMAAYMGIFWDSRQYYDSLPPTWLEPGEGGERVLKAGIYPPKPTLSRREFEDIKDYILSQAPDKTLPPENLPPIDGSGIPGFEAKILLKGSGFQPYVTGLRIQPGKKRIYASMYRQAFIQMDENGFVREQMEDQEAIVHIGLYKGKIGLTDIGSMVGADTPKGRYRLGKSIFELQTGKAKPNMDSLQRPVYSTWADLDQDGIDDLLMCEFGNQLGRIVWYKMDGKGQGEEKLLFADDGAIVAHVHDFNGDGKPDIVALVANADEGIDLYLNEGGGEFRRKRLFRFPPTYGSTAMELVDFDGDGNMDLLYAGGDNADFPPIRKASHGIRLFRNKGKAEFEEAWFLPMNGAYGLRARDFDQDGDMDIAAVSFYPDYAGRRQEAMLYYRNNGRGGFEVFTVPEALSSRWMILDSGDLDGDGDEDIVVGAFNVKSGDADEATYQQWMQNDAPVLLLENKLR